ncbi:hypothetical protein VNO78_07329 [Psophocarpus tetragonolobus]|uniref:Bet v I/Major latex protein domain-containing protein n=1 Tax=Psophocarpus tetragonolobus TaxID=3891 RepID=A0AAN9SV30_PSOTE
MALAGKITSEIGVHKTAEKWLNLYSKELHHIQNVAERIHGAKLHQGDDWHANDSVKHWTYIVDGKTVTCHETIESIDVENKTITFKLYGEDIDDKFKVFKLIFEAIDKNDGSAAIRWSCEYERLNKDVPRPYGYMEFCTKCAEDVDAYFVKAEENANK